MGCVQEDLPEDVRVAKERVLQLLRDELGKSYDDARTKRVAKKYKMVKFFGNSRRIIFLFVTSIIIHLSMSLPTPRRYSGI